MEPAASIIERLGGPAVVSEITGTAYTAPYRWTHSVEKRGTGGLIPQKHHLKLLAYARSKGIALAAADFLPVHDDPPGAVSGPACRPEPASAEESAA